MPSGRHLRGPTLRTAATKADTFTSKDRPQRRGAVLSCACSSNPDVSCRLNRLSEGAQVLALPVVEMAWKNYPPGDPYLLQHQLQHQF